MAENVDINEKNIDLPQKSIYLFSTIYGINELMALILQSILTMIVADKNGLFVLDINSQVIFKDIFFIIIVSNF